MTIPAGTRLGPYEIVAPFGAGGMGEVYRARDSRLGREVAIKVLPESVASDDRLRRFEKEARSASALNHPNIVTVYDIGSTDGRPWIAMERVDGKTLRELLFNGPLPPKRLIPIAAQIADGLARAHEAGIVHRDLKPENVMVTKDGIVKILDFGLAKRSEAEFNHSERSQPPTETETSPGAVLGTVGYLSPEQVRGLSVDHRSDIFSFGAILLELLSGERAFKRDTPADTMSAILNEDPVPLSAPRAAVSGLLLRIAWHCLEKEPKNRFQSARDIAFALRESSDPTSLGLPAPARSTRRTFVIAGSALVLLGVAGGFLYRSLTRAPVAVAVKRVAVLPFENLGPSENEYFADGMADAVRGKLTSLPGIEVIARGSCVGYKQSAKTSKQIAAELNAPYLLSATIRWEKVGNTSRVQVRPELVEVDETRGATSKWQQPFDAALTDVFDVQAEIATEVAQALGVALGSAVEKQIADRPTHNIAAYDSFLRGEEAWGKFYFKDAAAEYKRAISQDPKFATAMLRLSRVVDREEARTWIARARRLPERLGDRDRLWLDLSTANESGRSEDLVPIATVILARYPDDAQAANIVCNDHIAHGRRDQAIRIQSEVLARDPRNASVLNQIAYYWAYDGEYQKAVSYLERYKALGPGDANPYDSFGEVQAYAGHYDEAIANLSKALALRPDFNFSRIHLAVAYEGKGEVRRAVRTYLMADEIGGDALGGVYLSWASYAAIWSGDRVAATEVAAYAAKQPARKYADLLKLQTLVMLDLVESRNSEAELRLVELGSRLRSAFEDLPRIPNASRILRCGTW